MDLFFSGFKKAFLLISAFDRELFSIIYLSMKVSGLALVIATTAGIPLGAILALKSFPLRRIIILVMNTFMGLPPVLVGLLLYLALSRSGPLGILSLLYTPSAMVIAQSILAFPIVVSLTQSAIMNVDPIIREASMTLGATPFQITLNVIKEARYGIISGVMAAFGRVVAEVGAVLIVGGNISNYTRVMTTTIALETDKGNFELALALGMILLIISLIVNMLFHLIQRKGKEQRIGWI